MAKYVFNLPDVGEGVVEGEIVKWNVKPGDTVKEDEPLVELMTDKATVSIPSSVNGKVVSTTGKPETAVSGLLPLVAVVDVTSNAVHAYQVE